MWAEHRKCGLTLVSERKGNGPHCRIDNANGREVYRGTYEECVAYLKARNAW